MTGWVELIPMLQESADTVLLFVSNMLVYLLPYLASDMLVYFRGG